MADEATFDKSKLVPELAKFLENLTHWLAHLHELRAVVFPKSATKAIVALWHDECLADEDESEDDYDAEEGNFYVGSCATAGLCVQWLGNQTFDDPDDKDDKIRTGLVLVNGSVFSDLGRVVAGWVAGAD